MSMRVVYRSLYFKSHYNKKLEGKSRFGQELNKKEALCAVAVKLIKVIFTLLRDKRTFTAKAPSLALVI